MMRTYTWNGNRFEISSPHLIDLEVAGRVRMLMRDQLNHEFICTEARDRIVCLSEEKKALEEHLEKTVAALRWLDAELKEHGYAETGHMRRVTKATISNIEETRRTDDVPAGTQ